MGDHHAHGVKGRILFSFALNIIITIAEVVGGLLSGSLALLSDSLHNFGDSMSLLASYFAIRIGERKANEKYTFGYRRVEILVAFMNSAVLVGVSLLLLVEAYRRFKNPEPIDGPLMLGVALIGLFANLFSVLLLHEHAHGLNVRSAYLHLLTDTLSSVAVVAGGIAIMKWNILWIDPLVTVFISLYILREAYEILRESIEVLMEASPELDLEAVKREIEAIPGVKNAHHFHAWRIGEDEVHFECHVEVDDMPLGEAQRIIDEIEERLRKFGITHVTVQLEVDRCDGKNLLCGDGDA
ncbi:MULTISPECIES: cation diffusion facilitator family transporter [Thermococcus]|uniref:Cobalt/zinc/cadmium cation efflux pump protein n=2 Tax=Thermococcus sibiricus TaxID=172049 RepID=C6A553_THESM|nr:MULTISPECIES: cation diffusion facilitator family transporter [Thermococcus]ACS90748.1 Cobalt/zinc/cadmium cation efflux pump protein [Thermococcus sibiricus MM 739]KUK17494.1 MAG: Cobalt/zinc/cadmium cation efflux pump protein [Thermococcus sibiricus]MBC7094229.1 cation transporter [Thermococcus sp.]